MNAHESDAKSSFNSQAHIISNIIEIHKHCTKCETFQFALLAGSLITQEMRLEPDLSLVQDKM